MHYRCRARADRIIHVVAELVDLHAPDPMRATRARRIEPDSDYDEQIPAGRRFAAEQARRRLERREDHRSACRLFWVDNMSASLRRRVRLSLPLAHVADS